MATLSTKLYLIVILLAIFSCTGKKDRHFESELKSINLKQGDITLCGAADGKFGTVEFTVSCLDKVRGNFNLATALLHSFEYDEAEKVFAKVINEDPACVMAYWGVAMSNFHALWSPQGQADLKKGSKAIALARSLNQKSKRESDYLDAVAAFYVDWDKFDHKTRCLRFEKAMESVYQKYPQDKEAAIFYALALNATAVPSDKSFINQRKAGEILKSLYPNEPNHPGIAHYIIHTFDYPELAELALPMARKYASVAPASAHAQHMPSHIFTRLGLWDESIGSNLASISAAQCYAANIKMNGHWDEELHGMDYLTYAYLQEGNDTKAKKQLDLLRSYRSSVNNNKVAYVFAAIPARYALERKHWSEATKLEVFPSNFPWDKFLWEKAITHFAKGLGYVNTHDITGANIEVKELKSIHKRLTKVRDAYKASYKADQVLVQIKSIDAWIHLAGGRKEQALGLMTQAADMEDATEKSSVTPGEVIPARELLADMYMEIGETTNALKAYEADLQRHPNRFNGLYGAASAEQKLGNNEKAGNYFRQLLRIAHPTNSKRPELMAAIKFVKD